MAIPRSVFPDDFFVTMSSFIETDGFMPIVPPILQVGVIGHKAAILVLVRSIGGGNLPKTFDTFRSLHH